VPQDGTRGGKTEQAHASSVVGGLPPPADGAGGNVGSSAAPRTIEEAVQLATNPAITPPVQSKLREGTEAFTLLQILVVCLFVVMGLWLRLRGLAAEGFADDEVHKWLAATRYAQGNFAGGDELEHPMLMKSLITLALLGLGKLGWAPEAIVRLPNALAGGASIAVLALLGRKLYGPIAGVAAAGLAAFSTTFIGYQRVAKEDTLLGLFVLLLVLCLGEARSAADQERPQAQRRWEWLGAASLGLMFASKYFFMLAPVPVAFYFWVRRTGTRWRVPFSRWLALIAGSLLVFAAFNWTPFMPSSWEYMLSYFLQKKTVHGALFFMGRIYHNLPSWWLDGTPPWFYVVFALVKFSPLTVIAWIAGLFIALRRRDPSDRLLLSWMGIWFLGLSISGSKWGRFFVSVLPAFLLLASLSISRAVAWARTASLRTASLRTINLPRLLPAAASLLLFLVLAGEAWASATHWPHYRLYVNALGGGDRNVDYFFPHCDYFDAGYREAIQAIAEVAEPRAEIATEIDWPGRYYADHFGRPDLAVTMMRPETGCRGDHACYAVVQTGRWYFQNRDTVEFLSHREPWRVVRVGGHEAVKIYRLRPGESPFPPAPASSSPSVTVDSVPWPRG
jgi:4-amino-4-deoxy-L-arabinose transferase-like glycosyltransferase